MKERRKNRPRSSSQETRARVLDAARVAFCHAGFDHVGLREIATRAGTDAAIVIRLFGSKEALFEEVAKDAFKLVPAFQASREALGAVIADFLLGPGEEVDAPEEFDAFRFLLSSASSPVAAPIVSASLHGSFVVPLAAYLDGETASGRAALIVACVLGFTTMRFALMSPALEFQALDRIRRPLSAAIQACIDA
jgi:AcrR family transcriptional regulator